MTTTASARDASAPGEGPAVTDALLAFTRGLRARHVRFAAAGGALRALLGLAVPCIVVAWLVPAWRLQALAVLLAVPAASALLAAWRARALAATALLAGAEATSERAATERREMGELQDELATWLEHHGGAATPMRDWLARDVHGRIGRLQPAVLAEVGRRRLGRLLWLLPLALLLLLAWLIADWLAPPWAGVLGGRATAPGSGPGDGPGDGRGGSSDRGGGDTPDDPQPGQPQPHDPPRKPPPPLKPPEPPPAAEDEPKPPEPPAPLLDLPPQQRFVVPEFIGDGPTRRARMHAAAADEPEGGAAQAQPRGDAPANAPPPPTREQFERAAEAALRARHVPPAEQPMVRRFFDALREAAK